MVLAEADWGSVPDWVAAIGTVGTLLGAVLILNKQRSALDHQVQSFAWQAEDRARAAVDREREQALRVTGWVEWDGENQIIGHVANGSDAPIYGCVLFVKEISVFEEILAEVVDGEVVPTGKTDVTIHDLELVFQVVPPQAAVPFPYTLRADQRRAVEDLPFGGIQAAVGFVDSAGHPWLRHPDGRLARTEAPPRIC